MVLPPSFEMKDSQALSSLSRSQLPSMALLLLLPLLGAWFASSFGIHIQSPFILERINSPSTTTGREVNRSEIPVSTNPVDVQLHLTNGQHYMMDFHGIDKSDMTFLDTVEGQAAVAQAIIDAGMTFLGSRPHIFPGGGLTADFLLSESHMSLHTWPEHSFATIDIHTHGNSVAAGHLVLNMHALLKPRTANIEPGSGLLPSVRVNKPSATDPILFNTQRPDGLVLPAKRGICINADFDGDECILWNVSLMYSQRSEVQLVEVVELQPSRRRCLLLDAVPQFCDSPDNELYTRSLTERVMPPAAHARTADVDIYVVGGGDGWIGNHILNNYPSAIRSVHVIDIDPLVSDVTRKFFPVVSGTDSFKDSRVKYIAGDAVMWLRNAPDSSADGVIIDCTDHTVSSKPPSCFLVKDLS